MPLLLFLSPPVTIDPNDVYSLLGRDENVDKNSTCPSSVASPTLYILQSHSKWGDPTPKPGSYSSEFSYFDGPVAELTLAPLTTSGASSISCGKHKRAQKMSKKDIYMRRFPDVSCAPMLSLLASDFPPSFIHLNGFIAAAPAFEVALAAFLAP